MEKRTNAALALRRRLGDRLGAVIDYHLRPIAASVERNRALLEQLSVRLGEVTENGSPGRLSFTCNICSQTNSVPVVEFHREVPSCSACGSNPRFRAIIHVLTTELTGRSTTLDELSAQHHITGIGLTDWEGYASRLSNKFDYINTFYDSEPQLDIAAPDTRFLGSADFVIATDVFEHVPPPVSVGFSNARRLLRPGGVFILSVPYCDGDRTIEHYPDLHDFEIIEDSTGHKVRNRTAKGEVQEFDNPVFHGGPGLNLEMRFFSKKSLRSELESAGFKRIAFYPANDLIHGAYWPDNQSLPVAARVD